MQGNIVDKDLQQGWPAKNLYTKSERLALSCRVNWAWSERVNLYNGQIMILPRKTNTYATESGLRPGSGNLYRLSPPVGSVSKACSCVLT